MILLPTSDRDRILLLRRSAQCHSMQKGAGIPATSPRKVVEATPANLPLCLQGPHACILSGRGWGSPPRPPPPLHLWWFSGQDSSLSWPGSNSQLGKRPLQPPQVTDFSGQIRVGRQGRVNLEDQWQSTPLPHCHQAAPSSRNLRCPGSRKQCFVGSRVLQLCVFILRQERCRYLAILATPKGKRPTKDEGQEQMGTAGCPR